MAKTVCIYCNAKLSSKSTLNRHLATCKNLTELVLRNPSNAKSLQTLVDIDMRNKQLDMIKKRERICAFCGMTVASEKKLNSHLSSVHNFPK